VVTVDILLDVTPGRGMSHRHIAEPMRRDEAQLRRRSGGACMSMLVADASVEEVPSSDVIVVPGRPGRDGGVGGAAALERLGRAHEMSRWTTTVHAPARLLGAAGSFEGKAANMASGRARRAAKVRRGVGGRSRRCRGQRAYAAGDWAVIDMPLLFAALEAGEERGARPVARDRIRSRAAVSTAVHWGRPTR
jgi:putative intracellular protease/amidase